MKILLIILALFGDVIGSITKISKENTIKKEAEEAFKKGDYKTASSKYFYLTDSLRVSDENALLNLGHSYYKLNDYEQASKVYEKLSSSKENTIKSIATQQLGVLSYKVDHEKEKALTYFKEALMANPENDEARYNYEFLKKTKEVKEDKKDEKDQKDNKQNQQEPSEFAKKLKAQAERLVSERRYGEAYNLMTEGVKKDPTVNLFQDFTKRIKDVVDINKL